MLARPVEDLQCGVHCHFIIWIGVKVPKGTSMLTHLISFKFGIPQFSSRACYTFAFLS